MSNFHIAHQIVENTQVGHKLSGYATVAVVAASKTIGGAALATAVAAAAPVLVPVGFVVGLTCLLNKCSKH